jgi:hypothetical protein
VLEFEFPSSAASCGSTEEATSFAHSELVPHRAKIFLLQAV